MVLYWPVILTPEGGAETVGIGEGSGIEDLTVVDQVVIARDVDAGGLQAGSRSR